MGEDSTAIKESSGRGDITILRLKVKESVEMTVKAVNWHVYTNGLLLNGRVLHSHTAHSTTAAGSSSLPLPSLLHIPFHIPLTKFLDPKKFLKKSKILRTSVYVLVHTYMLSVRTTLFVLEVTHLYVTTYNIHLMKQIRIGKANSVHPEVKASQSNNIKYRTLLAPSSCLKFGSIEDSRFPTLYGLVNEQDFICR